MTPAPITAPVMSLTFESRGVLSSQALVPVVGHAPPGAPGELGLQVTGAMCFPLLEDLLALRGYRKAGSILDGPYSSKWRQTLSWGLGRGQTPNVLIAEGAPSPTLLYSSGSSVMLSH